MHDTATRSSLPRNLGAFALTLAAYASAVSTAQAQTGDSVIQGRVTTADTQSIIPEAIVTVRSPALQGEQTVVTDNTGFYRVPNLPPGTYVVRVDKEDHSSFEQPGIVLRSSTTLRVDGVLVPATTKAEEIYLTADAPTVDVGSSSVSTNISNEMVKRVPISRPGTKGGSARSFESVAQAAPEARADLYGTSMSGATSPENRYIIDGLAVNNTAYGIGSTPLSAEFIHEVNVVTGGYLPEYGRSTGGVLNVITKSGVEPVLVQPVEQHHPGRAGGQPQVPAPRGQHADLGPAQDRHDLRTWAPTWAGPSSRDKLWFYVGADFGMTRYDIKRGLYETQLDGAGMPMKEMRNGQSFTVRNLIPGTTQEYDSEATAAQFIGKLNLAASKNHSLALNVIYAPYRSGSAGGFGIDAQDGRPDPLVTAIGDYNVHRLPLHQRRARQRAEVDGVVQRPPGGAGHHARVAPRDPRRAAHGRLDNWATPAAWPASPASAGAAAARPVSTRSRTSPLPARSPTATAWRRSAAALPGDHLVQRQRGVHARDRRWIATSCAACSPGWPRRWATTWSRWASTSS